MSWYPSIARNEKVDYDIYQNIPPRVVVKILGYNSYNGFEKGYGYFKKGHLRYPWWLFPSIYLHNPPRSSRGFRNEKKETTIQHPIFWRYVKYIYVGKVFTRDFFKTRFLPGLKPEEERNNIKVIKFGPNMNRVLDDDFFKDLKYPKLRKIKWNYSYYESRREASEDGMTGLNWEPSIMKNIESLHVIPLGPESPRFLELYEFSNLKNLEITPSRLSHLEGRVQLGETLESITLNSCGVFHEDFFRQKAYPNLRRINIRTENSNEINYTGLDWKAVPSKMNSPPISILVSYGGARCNDRLNSSLKRMIEERKGQLDPKYDFLDCHTNKLNLPENNEFKPTQQSQLLQGIKKNRDFGLTFDFGKNYVKYERSFHESRSSRSSFVDITDYVTDKNIHSHFHKMMYHQAGSKLILRCLSLFAYQEYYFLVDSDRRSYSRSTYLENDFITVDFGVSEDEGGGITLEVLQVFPNRLKKVLNLEPGQKISLE